MRFEERSRDRHASFPSRGREGLHRHTADAAGEHLALHVGQGHRGVLIGSKIRTFVDAEGAVRRIDWTTDPLLPHYSRTKRTRQAEPRVPRDLHHSHRSMSLRALRIRYDPHPPWCQVPEEECYTAVCQLFGSRSNTCSGTHGICCRTVFKLGNT